LVSALLKAFEKEATQGLKKIKIGTSIGLKNKIWIIFILIIESPGNRELIILEHTIRYSFTNISRFVGKIISIVT